MQDTLDAKNLTGSFTPLDYYHDESGATIHDPFEDPIRRSLQDLQRTEAAGAKSLEACVASRLVKVNQAGRPSMTARSGRGAIEGKRLVLRYLDDEDEHDTAKQNHEKLTKEVNDDYDNRMRPRQAIVRALSDPGISPKSRRLIEKLSAPLRSELESQMQDIRKRDGERRGALRSHDEEPDSPGGIKRNLDVYQAVHGVPLPDKYGNKEAKGVKEEDSETDSEEDDEGA